MTVLFNPNARKPLEVKATLRLLAVGRESAAVAKSAVSASQARAAPGSAISRSRKQAEVRFP
jgi:hypothetical protein